MTITISDLSQGKTQKVFGTLSLLVLLAYKLKLYTLFCTKKLSACVSLALCFVFSFVGFAGFANMFTDLQSGCCKPSDDCGFAYVSPTVWTKNATSSTVNPDCNEWDNDAKVLCFNCQSCKAGLLDNLKSNWKKTAVVNIVFLIFLIVVYSVGCCAFRNNRRDNEYYKQ